MSRIKDRQFNGKRLQQARELARLTRVDLAAELGQLEQIIVLAEESDFQPDETLQKQIALRLGFPLLFFYKEDPPEFPRGSLDWHWKS